jgi:subtilisin family serine protease
MLLNRVGTTTGAAIVHKEANGEGQGVLVGVADTGLDVSHADMRDPSTGLSRVAWMIDYSLKPAGLYPDLEKKFGILDASGNPIAGCVLRGTDIDLLLANGTTAPGDENGHGTHVTSIAAGNGGAVPTVSRGIRPRRSSTTTSCAVWRSSSIAATSRRSPSP